MFWRLTGNRNCLSVLNVSKLLQIGCGSRLSGFIKKIKRFHNNMPNVHQDSLVCVLVQSSLFLVIFLSLRRGLCFVHTGSQP